MKKSLFNRYKGRIIGSGIFLWLAMLIIGVVKEPNSGQSAMNYLVMEEDIKYILKNGGIILAATDVVKPGRAHVSRVIDVEGWSDTLLFSYQKTLHEKGWIKLNSTDYCKQGIFARVVANAGMRDGRESNLISMEYDALSAGKCKTANGSE